MRLRRIESPERRWDARGWLTLVLNCAVIVPRECDLWLTTAFVDHPLELMDWVDVTRLSRDEGVASFGHELDALRFQQVCAATLGRAVRAGAQQAGFAMVDNY